MWVRAKEKIQLTAAQDDMIISQSVQKGSKWLAFHEPNVNSSLPWRVNHRHLNIRLRKERFEEIFEEVKYDE